MHEQVGERLLPALGSILRLRGSHQRLENVQGHGLDSGREFVRLAIQDGDQGRHKARLQRVEAAFSLAYHLEYFLSEIDQHWI